MSPLPQRAPSRVLDEGGRVEGERRRLVEGGERQVDGHAAHELLVGTRAERLDGERQHGARHLRPRVVKKQGVEQLERQLRLRLVVG